MAGTPVSEHLDLAVQQFVQFLGRAVQVNDLDRLRQDGGHLPYRSEFFGAEGAS